MNKDKAQIFTSLSSEGLSEILAEKIIEMIRVSVSSGRPFNMALSGGNTPKILFEYIAGKYGDSDIWKSVNFYWVDERCVPPDHPDSNYRMCMEAMLYIMPGKGGNAYRMMGETDPPMEAQRYSRLLKDRLPRADGLPVFDLVLLGMGTDGHTASIFPDQMELLWTNKLCTVGVHPESGQKRITLSGTVINNSENVIFLVTGKEKAQLVSLIINHDPRSEIYPAAHINPTRGSLCWFLDRESSIHLTP